MKKIITIIGVLCLITGCNDASSAKDIVESYLNSYQNLEYQVLVDMEEVVSNESDFTSSQKELYRDILKKQYSDLTYEIISESYNDDESTVKVEITVYDFYKVEKEATFYQEENLLEFYEGDNYSLELYLDYKLDLYQKSIERVTYTVEFLLIKENDVWKLLSPSNEILEKIHGIYNYE